MSSTHTVNFSKPTRQRTPKVRTGCITCKTRRIKCDETRPGCLRCTSTGRKCAGYPQPKGNYRVQVFTVTQSHEVARELPKFTEIGDNVHYLEFYYHCTSTSISDKFDREFWSRTCLQIAQTEPAVRHALIALGYLNKCETGSLKHTLMSSHQHKTLLFHYNKSVRHLVDRMADPSFPPGIGLVACLLFVCIEFMRANAYTAMIHMRNGFKIISEFHQRHRIRTPLRLPESPQNEISSPPSMIEDKVVPIFTRAMTSALLQGMAGESDLKLDFKTPYWLSRFFSSESHASVREAQLSYHDLRNASVVWLLHAAHKVHQEIPVMAEDISLQNHILDCHQRWCQALRALETSQALSTEDKIAISALKVSYFTTSMGTACAYDGEQMSWDSQLSNFKELLRHAKVVVESMNLGPSGIASTKPSSRATAANFTFEITLIPHLWLTATYCRCPTTRREALALLSLNLPREGLWDAEQHAIVAKRVIEMEEMSVDERGWPTQETRLWSTNIDRNLDRNGGFWVSFLPARLLPMFARGGHSVVLRERFVLGSDDRNALPQFGGSLRTPFEPPFPPLV
ncbi:hypothetical protein BCR34DRAFT_239211 [Clohesyomyces aquaticus]|uniref:Zn(2)-C6 fungal-type domain-containing protein n=1 Tax=Clohesyomyces aquaticus TaxID=1231657 RepID=A0A1Y1ZVS4_9PLEO|nr:hypothetical protein BCR34DRAFT_239211 [Clohesyomyces aquaticus]